jgi:hypothetical protein
MYQYRRFLLTFIFAFGIPVLFVSQIYKMIGESLANRASTQGDYLESLRNNTEFGCLTVLSREPELLLIGNSGSYASWDMRQLQSKTGLRVGGCMMGGATIETLELILDLASHLRNPPKHVIVGSNVYLFLKSKAAVSQLSKQKNLLIEARFSYEFWLKHFFRQLLDLRSYPTLSVEQDKAIEIHRIPLEANDDIIETLIVSTPLPSIDAVIALNNAKRLEDFGASNVKLVCAKTQKIGAKLWVINIPTSPKAESIYSDDLWNYYLKALNGFDECAEKVIRLRAYDYGLANRHFVNRWLKYYPYNDWRIGKSNELYFDADHPNPFGAERFTKLAICLIFGKNNDSNFNDQSRTCF